MKPVSGLTLGNRYRLVRLIAVGGMGEVWVAKDTALSREVAVKVLREEFAGNEDFLERLRTEARNSAALSHRNIAQMFDYGEQRGSGYLVMELVHGEPMADLLEREPVIPLPRLLPILSQTALALHAAHSAGVVHRDVKPGNILLDRSGEVKITDFGVSLAANQVPMTATGMVMGTAQYLSPEQAIGQAATGASDIYALGIVAYESVAGHRPFTGATPVDIAVAHVNETVPPLPANVDGELAELIMAMLAKDPHERPHPADALAQAFQEMTRRVTDDPWNSPAGRRPAGRGRHGVGAEDAAARRREDLAPVITPIVIPAAVRRSAPSDDARPDRLPAGAVSGIDSTTSTPPSAPALPWERPQTTKDTGSARSGTSRRRTPDRSSPAADTPAQGDVPRAYPPRRDLRHQVPAAVGRPTSEDRTGTRAGRRQTTTAPTTRRKSGQIPRFTWPLVALVVLLAVILVVTIVTRGNAVELGTSAQVSSSSAIFSAGTQSSPVQIDEPQIVMTSLPPGADVGAVSGMIASDIAARPAPAAPTTPKDI